MKPQRTPGEWRAETEDQSIVIWAHPYEYDIAVCEIFAPPRDLAGDRPVGDQWGNANLIAAAQDLLAALEAVSAFSFTGAHDAGRDATAELDALWANARAAILKAKGEK